MNRELAACAAVALTAVICGCVADVGINEFKYACQKDTDCNAGQTCQNGACAKLSERHDGGTADTGIHKDAGADAGQDAGADGGVDGGADGGIGDGGFVIMYTSTFDSAAGTSTMTSYKLKMVTGWSTGPKQGAGGYQLKTGQPFKTGEK